MSAAAPRSDSAERRVSPSPPRGRRRTALGRSLPVVACAAAVACALAVPAAGPAAELARPMSSAAGFRLSGNYSNAEFFPDLDTAQRIARTHAMLVLSQGWQLGFDGPTWDGTVEDTFLDEMKAVNP